MAESNILISIDMMDKGMTDSNVAEVTGKYPHNRTSSLSGQPGQRNATALVTATDKLWKARLRAYKHSHWQGKWARNWGTWEACRAAVATATGKQTDLLTMWDCVLPWWRGEKPSAPPLAAVPGFRCEGIARLAMLCG
jgi:hypothetical protein